MEKQIPLLTPTDVELRVAQIKKTKYGVYVNLLAYKNARVDMKILDKVYGPTNWQRKHKLIGDRLYCTISIWDEDKKCWVEKEDVGTESYTEKEKGQSSDSFKRAGFCWGIGRELYDAPNIRIKLEDGEYSEVNGKPATYAKFTVAEMVYNPERGEFDKFVVVDKNGNIRFSHSTGRQKQAVAEQKPTTGANSKVQEQNAPESRPEPKEWVKEYKGRQCVYVLGGWVYLDKIQHQKAILKILAVDAEGKYAAVKEVAEKMLAELAKGAA